MSIVIRQAGTGDARRLAAVGQATFLETFAGILAGDDILAHCANQHSVELYEGWLKKPDVGLWLAEAAGAAPVGYAVLAPPDLPVADPGPGDVEIKRIYLLHRFQGGGVGLQLMAAALEAARAAAKSRALLGVYGKNERAIAFYEKVGFRQIGERRFQVGSGWYDDIVLARPLRD
jgi:ribosomal protein S18 acetylase RimI-like enzyme